MDIRQLRTLVAVAEFGTFGRAAEAVNLTPSAVSQQINALETEVGAKLFDRSSRPPVLNTQGLQMLDAAHKLIRTAEEAIDAISGRRVIGTFNLGSVRTSAFALLPRAIIAMQAKFPDLLIKLRVGLTEPFLADVAAGRLDAAVVAEHVGMPRELRWSPFIREPLLVIAPPGSPRLAANKLLESLPFIRFRNSVPLATLIDTELARLGLRLKEIAEIDTIAAIVPCVRHGLGAAIVPNVAVQDPALADLVTAPFGKPQVHRQMGLVERARNPSAAVVEALHGELARLCGAFGVERLPGDPAPRPSRRQDNRVRAASSPRDQIKGI
jgi:DNA-binding transcriptional LysR family regulator